MNALISSIDDVATLKMRSDQSEETNARWKNVSPFYGLHRKSDAIHAASRDNTFLANFDAVLVAVTVRAAGEGRQGSTVIILWHPQSRMIIILPLDSSVAVSLSPSDHCQVIR